VADASGAAGTPNHVVARLASFRNAVLARTYLQVLDVVDLSQVRLIAAKVAPQLENRPETASVRYYREPE
jgi:hypothetical protein